jgi:integrase
LSAAQAAALVQACPTVCRPYLVLSLYAGIRPDELLRLTWSNVDLAAGLVRVDGKTRRQRIVPLEPIALALLRAHPLRSGPVSPSYFTIRRWKRGARAILGVSAWPKDILRHTAASFLLARYQDTAKVSFWLGNSPAILMRHYYAPVSAEDCSAFWNVEG